MQFFSFLATIFTCLSAIGAFFAAVKANQIANSVKRLERESVQRSVDEMEQREARLVTAWIARDENQIPYVVINNASSGPIREVGARVDGFHVKKVSSQDVIPSGQFCLRKHPQGRWPWTKAIPTADLEQSLVPDTKSNSLAVRELTFTDPQGRSWRVDERGRLSRQADAELPVSADATTTIA